MGDGAAGRGARGGRARPAPARRGSATSNSSARASSTPSEIAHAGTARIESASGVTRPLIRARDLADPAPAPARAGSPRPASGAMRAAHSSGLRISRWARAGTAMAFTSSGSTKSRRVERGGGARQLEQRERAARGGAERHARIASGWPARGPRCSARSPRPRAPPRARPAWPELRARDHRRELDRVRAPLAPPGQDLDLVLGPRIAHARRIRKRSSWASGSGYVPSSSIGFWVAITRNGASQREALALDRDLRLLHRLQQRALGLGRGPVDLVGQQEVGEDGPRRNSKRPSRWS